jgi:hypothetical protein
MAKTLTAGYALAYVSPKPTVTVQVSSSREPSPLRCENGPRNFSPSELTFGSDLQTLEELKAELEAKR